MLIFTNILIFCRRIFLKKCFIIIFKFILLLDLFFNNKKFLLNLLPKQYLVFSKIFEVYRRISSNYHRLITKIKFELYNHDEKDFIDTLEKEVLKITSNCKYFPPQSVTNVLQINGKIKHIIEDSEHNREQQQNKSINVTINK